MKEVSVEQPSELAGEDLADLCAATRAAIGDGGGFGWVEPPSDEELAAHWRAVLAQPDKDLFVARLRGRIVGSGQLLKPVTKNQAGGHIAHLSTFFLAPSARGRGLGRELCTAIDDSAQAQGFTVICLDVRSTQKSAIALYEAAGYRRWGTKPKYARVDGRYLDGHYYVKDLD